MPNEETVITDTDVVAIVPLAMSVPGTVDVQGTAGMSAKVGIHIHME